MKEILFRSGLYPLVIFFFPNIFLLFLLLRHHRHHCPLSFFLRSAHVSSFISFALLLSCLFLSFKHNGLTQWHTHRMPTNIFFFLMTCFAEDGRVHVHTQQLTIWIRIIIESFIQWLIFWKSKQIINIKTHICPHIKHLKLEIHFLFLDIILKCWIFYR